MTPPEPNADLALRLLRESDWVRRLARSLVAGDADAEDLAQDTLVDALQTRGSGTPRSLRAWLGTVTRRKAAERLRRRSIEEGALDELKASMASGDVSVESDERFIQHEELARAVRKLPAAERHLILRRHVDQVPPRELAKELGLTSAQVRKRLTRALFKLRRELDASERGRAGWSRALLVLAAPEPRSTPAPLIAVTAMSTTKKFLAAAVILAVGATAWRFQSAATPSALPELAQQGEAELEAPPRIPAPGPEVDPERIALSVTDEEPVATDLAAPAVAARVRIVDDSGQPVPDADGVWLDSASEIHPFKVDADGGFSIDANEQARVFARSERLCHVYAELPATQAGATVDVILPVRATLTFLVTVNGEPPAERLSFQNYGGPLMDAVKGQDVLLKELQQHGFPPTDPIVECSPDGRVSVELPERQESISLRVPSGYFPRAVRVAGLGAVPRASFTRLQMRLDELDTLVELTRLPALEGRFVWADSGEPYAEPSHFARRRADGVTMDGIVGMRPPRTGRFRIPTHRSLHGVRDLTFDEWHELGERPGGIVLGDVLGERAARVWISPVARGAVEERHEYEVPKEGDTLDVGDVPVRRLPTLKLRTLGRVDGEWVPIEAGVRSSQAAIKTGVDGRGALRFWPGDTLQVLATGFDFTAVDVSADWGDGVLEIQLEPAPTLEVMVPQELLDPTGRQQPQVKIAYDTTPFGSWSNAAAAPVEMSHRMYEAYLGPFVSGLSKLQDDYMLIPVPASGIVSVPGLRRGAVLQVSLTDHQGGVYVTQRVVFDGPTTLDQWGETIARAYVEIRFVDSGGIEAPSGRFAMSTSSSSGRYMDFEQGEASAGPLAPGNYRLIVYYHDASEERVSRTFKDIEIAAGSNTLTFDLARR